MGNVHQFNSAPHQKTGSDARIIPFERANAPPSSTVSPLSLARLIEGEIIPRLLLAHQGLPLASAGVVRLDTITSAEVSDVAEAALSDDGDALRDRVEGLMDRGLSVEQVYLDLLSPTAKLLGQMWDEDLCSFMDVTMGLCRLQQLVYDIGGRSQPLERGDRGQALFTLTPGDQHAFGLVLVSEFFRRAGWRTMTAAGASAAELVDIVASRHFDLVGFSMADEHWLTPLTPLIAELRAASCNTRLRVIVGGRVFSDVPERVAEVGADPTAEDPRQAAEHAQRCWKAGSSSLDGSITAS